MAMNKNRSLITKISKTALFTMALVSSLTFFVPSPEAFAGANEGSGGNMGGVPCVKPDGSLKGTICTRYGAEWRYYKADSDNIAITGVPGTMAASGHIVSCKTNGGGYYRYGMVAYADSPSRGYVAGDQVGLTAIGGGVFRSVNFGGRMMYANVGGGSNNTGSGPGTLVSWEEAHAKYLDYQAKFPVELKMGWNAQSNLSWFCAEPPKAIAVQGDNCEAWDPNMRGYAYVLAVVKNERLEGGYSGWRQAPRPGYNNGTANIELNTTYAMPGDEIKWVMCYWPGQERAKHDEAYKINGVVLGEHINHGKSTCYADKNKLVELMYSTNPTWPTSFEYHASTNAGSFLDGIGESSIYSREGVDMIDDVEITDKYDVGGGDVGKEYHDQIWTDGDASKVAVTDGYSCER